MRDSVCVCVCSYSRTKCMCVCVRARARARPRCLRVLGFENAPLCLVEGSRWFTFHSLALHEAFIFGIVMSKPGAPVDRAPELKSL